MTDDNFFSKIFLNLKRKEKVVIDDIFDDVSDFVNQNKGNNEYVCEYCGIYFASKPRCNKCEYINEKDDEKNGKL